MADQFKRYVAYKFHIGALLSGKPEMEGEKLKHLICGEKQVSRVNLIANVVDKYIQDGEKKFGSLTLDDATGQIKVKLFGEDVDKLQAFEQGDTVLAIGLLRHWNNEIYITPEILKKKDLNFLLVRKLEIESAMPKQYNKEQLSLVKDKLIELVRNADSSGGIDIEKIILELKEPADTISKEIKRLLEDGVAYEPRPGRLRWLG